jgi:hypothetical protein
VEVNKPEKIDRGPPPAGMSACRICGRHFVTERLAKHETICKKSNSKPKKVFDPQKGKFVSLSEAPVAIISKKPGFKKELTKTGKSVASTSKVRTKCWVKVLSTYSCVLIIQLISFIECQREERLASKTGRFSRSPEGGKENGKVLGSWW